jgi:hypothetical protein
MVGIFAFPVNRFLLLQDIRIAHNRHSGKLLSPISLKASARSRTAGQGMPRRIGVLQFTHERNRAQALESNRIRSKTADIN